MTLRAIRFADEEAKTRDLIVTQNVPDRVIGGSSPVPRASRRQCVPLAEPVPAFIQATGRPRQQRLLAVIDTLDSDIRVAVSCSLSTTRCISTNRRISLNKAANLVGLAVTAWRRDVGDDRLYLYEVTFGDRDTLRSQKEKL